MNDASAVRVLQWLHAAQCQKNAGHAAATGVDVRRQHSYQQRIAFSSLSRRTQLVGTLLLFDACMHHACIHSIHTSVALLSLRSCLRHPRSPPPAATRTRRRGGNAMASKRQNDRCIYVFCKKNASQFLLYASNNGRGEAEGHHACFYREPGAFSLRCCTCAYPRGSLLFRIKICVRTSSKSPPFCTILFVLSLPTICIQQYTLLLMMVCFSNLIGVDDDVLQQPDWGVQRGIRC